MNPLDEKKTIRDRVRAYRRTLEAAWIRQSSAVITERMRSLPEYASARCLGCYMSLPGEVQTMEFVFHCWDTGRQVCVPAFDADKAAYRMALMVKDEEMVPGLAGIMEPRVTCWVDPCEMDLIVVPGLAFDRQGARLGQGGGHYDRLLALCDTFKVGVAFAFQVVDCVPRGEHDIPMDVVLTEQHPYRCGEENKK